MALRLSLANAVRGIVAGLVFLAVPLAADVVYPRFTAPVVDAAAVLPAADKQAITQKLLDLQAKSNIQFAVATVPSLGGEEIEPYANGLFRAWKLGQKDVNNGLLLVVAPTEHRLRFEVGYGLEGTMTDIQSKLIIANTMVPKLKAGNAAGAIEAGVNDAITVLTSDKANWPRRLQPEDTDDTTIIIVLLIAAFVLFLLFRAFVRWRHWSFPIVMSSGGNSYSDANYGGSDSGSSGGDSFSGGGGGDSGGGGASGSW